MLGGSGWASFTLYERTTRASVAAEAPANARVEQLVAEAYEHLAVDELDVAREKLNQAAGLAEADARVQEGLVLVAVRSAERVWLEHRLATDAGARAKHLDELDQSVHAAREIIAVARRKSTDPPMLERITMAERQLNTMLVLAFMSDEKSDRARGVVGARLATHPQRALIDGYVGSAPAPPPAASASSSGATTPATASAPPVPPPPSWGNPQPYYNPQPYEPHYELDHEPNMKGKPKTTGELELPVTEPSPAPAPPPE